MWRESGVGIKTNLPSPHDGNSPQPWLATHLSTNGLLLLRANFRAQRTLFLHLLFCVDLSLPLGLTLAVGDCFLSLFPHLCLPFLSLSVSLQFPLCWALSLSLYFLSLSRIFFCLPGKADVAPWSAGVRPLWGGGVRLAEPLQQERDWPPWWEGKAGGMGGERAGLLRRAGEGGAERKTLWEEVSTTSPATVINCPSWPGTVCILTLKAPHPGTVGHSTLRPTGARMGLAGWAPRPDSFPPPPNSPFHRCRAAEDPGMVEGF